MAIIHPGTPRRPDEAGLEELLLRAAAFRVSVTTARCDAGTFLEKDAGSRTNGATLEQKQPARSNP